MFEIETEKPEPSVFINGVIDNDISTGIVEFINNINRRYPKDEITIEIDSDGGILSDVILLAELFQRVSNPIRTIALSNCSSGAVLLAAAGDKGKRLAWDRCEFMIHQVQVEDHISGSIPDIDEGVKNIRRMNEKFLGLMSEFTGQTIRKVRNDTRRDFYMSADQALKYGIIDLVVPRVKQR